MKRQSAVAGQFYESSPAKLVSQVDAYIEPGAEKENVLAAVSPHAGLMYSGGVAGKVYSRITIPHTFILIGPNHTGLGSPVSLMASGSWEIPTGELRIDEKIARGITKHCELVSEDSRAHQMEHSLEVQLPFILYFSSAVKILPITMMPLSLDACRTVGEAIADVIAETEYRATIIASSDMSHYVSDGEARKKDKRAIDRIIALDPEGLYNTVREEGITMCGVMPVTTMLFAAKKAGATESRLLKYMTSGEVSGDYEHVVGYAGVIVK